MGKNKKAKIEEPVESDHSSSEEDESMEVVNEEFNAMFEGRNLEEFDYHGIKQLLLQSFAKAPIDLSQITDMLINQQGIGSVLKQAPEDEDEEEDPDDANDVYGLTTVLNLSSHRETPCVVQIIDYLKKKAKTHASEATFNTFNNVLNKNEKLGLLINIRFVNIPSTIAAPMLSSLQDEINRRKKKDPTYNFQKFILICKIYKDKKGESSFVNEEEMLFSANAECNFEFQVAKDNSGDEENISSFQKVLLISADKLPDIITQITTFVQT